MYSRKSALSQAKIYRTCPPPYIADNPSHKKQLQQHSEICPYCSDQVMESRRQWGNLATHIRHFIQSPKKNNVLPGQLRCIRADLGRWHNGYFYNPPLVLVLENRKGNILAAQTYHDICLAAPGDLILSGEQTGAEDMFAESWNIYILKSEDLEPCTGQVMPDIVNIIKQLNKNADAYPDWAPQPKNLADHDVRRYFREIEAETGRIFKCRVDGALA
ncbi:hypothetical protein QUF80_21985 [Desulfococcaceae bacterium HSG8]|nr:hypothetical protein [Desulfococcaceae bacterium HSG8]